MSEQTAPRGRPASFTLAQLGINVEEVRKLPPLEYLQERSPRSLDEEIAEFFKPEQPAVQPPSRISRLIARVRGR
jgi:hypothetical protein